MKFDFSRPFIRTFGTILLFILLIVGISVLCTPYFLKLFDPQVQKQLQAWIDSLGLAGWLFMLGIQIVQVIIAFIPGEPVELTAGLLYGTWGGLLTCILGLLIASTIILMVVRRFGYPLVERLFGRKKLDQFDFLNNTRKIQTITFLLFLIPGTPKDMLTYLAGLSRIKISQFLLISTFARLPSIITSTWMGSTVSQGDWKMTIFVFLLTAAIGLFGILYRQKAMDYIHRHHTKRVLKREEHRHGHPQGPEE